ncbi:hypothetical protein EKO04_006426 [Ascochyta lentis]|uniref:Uncharacterized protein n=1 Tax=Ascochyta lentis TaxID=205686 RepID=A0A8H7MGI1_9PLEO|nr:hypothetical protein EKO04_006426 [Ascochyta lentis]
MSDSQPQRTILEKRNKTLGRLESHPDTSAGPSTDGTDGSTPRLLSLPKPGPIESSPEPSPDMVSGNAEALQNQIPAQTNIRPSRNAFARPIDRSGFESSAEGSDNNVPPAVHSSGPNNFSGVPPLTSVDLKEDKSIPHTPSPSTLSNAKPPPYAIAPAEGGFDFELHTEPPHANEIAATQATAHPPSTNTLQPRSTPDLQAQTSISSLRAAFYPRPTLIVPTSNTAPHPQVQLREHIPTNLPTREEPPAPTTIARIQRSLTRVFRTQNPPANEAAAVEMNVLSPSADVPRLARDGEAAEQRMRSEERRRWETEGLDRERVRGVTEEWRRQRQFKIWMPVCGIAGVMLFAVIYVAVTRGE